MVGYKQKTPTNKTMNRYFFIYSSSSDVEITLTRNSEKMNKVIGAIAKININQLYGKETLSKSKLFNVINGNSAIRLIIELLLFIAPQDWHVRVRVAVSTFKVLAKQLPHLPLAFLKNSHIIEIYKKLSYNVWTSYIHIPTPVLYWLEESN
tara:strand:- start:238 stop:690 length:453 start_codon:yes stop_codon:yes gene_type:complete